MLLTLRVNSTIAYDCTEPIFKQQLNTDGLKFLKNNAIPGDSRECIIFVKFQYPQVFNS